jgi:long-chain fatty acid transport protein
MTKAPVQWRGAWVATASASLALASGQAAASGFQINEQSASGLGVAFAGQAAAVHDASTVFWNPAGQALLPGRQAVGALSLILPSTRFEDSGQSTFSAFGNGGQGGENAVVPALYGTWQIDDRWSVGLAFNAPFGLATEWDATWAGQFHAVRSEIKTMNLNPTVAYKVSDALAIGAGLSYQRLEAELSNRAVLAPPFPTTAIGTGTVKGDDWGWGWNVGVLWSMAPSTQVGATYRSKISYTIEGNLEFSGFPAAVPGRAVRADVELPQTFSLGVSHRLDAKTRLLADWTWVGWDSIEELRIVDKATGASVSNTTLKFESAWRIGLGAEYMVDSAWLLRAGVAYDTTPVQDAYRTPRLPDEDRFWLALGARWTPGANAPWWVDVGFAYIWLREASSQLPYPGAPAEEVRRGALVGTYQGHVTLLSAQVGFRF